MIRYRDFHVEVAGMITTVLKWRHQQDSWTIPPASWYEAKKYFLNPFLMP